MGGGYYSADNEYTREVRSRLKCGDFHIAEEAVRAQRRADDLAYVAEACADWPERPAWFEDWEIERSGSHALLLVRGTWGVMWAWRARGVAWKPKDHGLFVSRMCEAEADLIAAAAKAPKDPTPWARRIIVSFAHQRSPEEVLGIFGEAVARAPQHVLAHSLMAKYLSWKWFGSSERMFDFVRQSVARAPVGSHLAGLLPEAHLERRLELAVREGRAAAAGYWRDPAVGAEILAAHNRCFHSGGFKPSMQTPPTRAAFAYTLWKTGQREAAAEHLRIIGPSTPWYPFGPPLPFAKDNVKRARRECGVS